TRSNLIGNGIGKKMYNITHIQPLLSVRFLDLTISFISTRKHKVAKNYLTLQLCAFEYCLFL
ncbi:MAG: hypothetical protein ACRDD8_02220, partial [Bacteroidales bacterium]